MQRNLVTYAVMINGCVRNGEWERGLSLLDELLAKGLQPDAVVFNAAITACDKGGLWEQALGLIDEMRERCPSSISLF